MLIVLCDRSCSSCCSGQLFRCSVFLYTVCVFVIVVKFVCWSCFLFDTRIKHMFTCWIIRRLNSLVTSSSSKSTWYHGSSCPQHSIIGSGQRIIRVFTRDPRDDYDSDMICGDVFLIIMPFIDSLIHWFIEFLRRRNYAYWLIWNSEIHTGMFGTVANNHLRFLVHWFIELWTAHSRIALYVT